MSVGEIVVSRYIALTDAQWGNHRCVHWVKTVMIGVPVVSGKASIVVAIHVVGQRTIAVGLTSVGTAHFMGHSARIRTIVDWEVLVDCCFVALTITGGYRVRKMHRSISFRMESRHAHAEAKASCFGLPSLLFEQQVESSGRTCLL